jgi:hypothetical protein
MWNCKRNIETSKVGDKVKMLQSDNAISLQNSERHIIKSYSEIPTMTKH